MFAANSASACGRDHPILDFPPRHAVFLSVRRMVSWLIDSTTPNCVFRMMWIADSRRSGSAIPDEVDHRFRPKWIAFGRCGSPISGIMNARR